MELVSYDKRTVTIRLDRMEELAGLMAVLNAVSADYASLDPELLMLPEKAVDRLSDEVFRISQEAG